MKSILLVDDEAIVCAELQRTLEGFGFHVKQAHTVEDALRSIRKAEFDAILLEFNLKSECGGHPRAENGLKLVRRFRAMKVAAPILMFTAMEGEPYESSSRDAGADEFIPKTAGLLSLVSRIHAHIRRSELGFRKVSTGPRGRDDSKPLASKSIRRTVKSAK